MVKIELPKLNYDYNELEPVISAKIMELHRSKHHAAYVNGANLAMEKLEAGRKGEGEVDAKSILRDLSFNLNGHLLHSLFWSIMTGPVKDNKPEGVVKQAIDMIFGSFDAFKKEFAQAAVSVEGSGWAVLASAPPPEKNLIIMSVEKHNLNHIAGYKPVLALDVWEHAYYLDYLNNRAEYVSRWWEVVNWAEVDKLI